MAVFIPKGQTEYHMKFRIPVGDPKGKQIFRSCKTSSEKQAIRIEERMIAKLQKEWEERGGRVLVGVPTLKDFARLPDLENGDAGGLFWKNFGNTEYTNPGTLRNFRRSVENLLRYSPFDKKLDEIKTMDVDGFRSWRLSGGKAKKDATVNRDLAMLRIILRRALRWEIIDRMACFELPKEAEAGYAIPTHEEDRYLAEFDKDHRDWAKLQIETAMMPSEAAELRWSDVGFGPCEAFGGTWENGYVYDRCEKTKFRSRPLPMTPALAAIMKERFEKREGPYVFPSARLGADQPTPLSSFQTSHQRFMHEDKSGNSCAKAAGLPRFRVYDFRHTALTRYSEANPGDIMGLMAMGGWNSLDMAKRYVKVGANRRNASAKIMAEHVDKMREMDRKKRAVGETTPAPEPPKPAATVRSMSDFLKDRQRPV